MKKVVFKSFLSPAFLNFFVFSLQRAVQCCLSDDFSAQQSSSTTEFKHDERHSPIMTELRARIVQFLENELEHLDRILSDGGSEQCRAEMDDEDMARSKEAVLHLCTHFLKDMKQDHLAQCLLSRSKIAKCVSLLKSNLKIRYECVFEGVAKAGHQTDLNQIYTDLCITEGHTEGVNFEHEV